MNLFNYFSESRFLRTETMTTTHFSINIPIDLAKDSMQWTMIFC